jgi:putative transposase
MSNYRRVYVPGGSYFFTVVTERRARILGTDLARDLLRAAFRDCFERWPPVRVDAMVMLRDHLHAIWTLPPDDCNYSKRWGAVKKHFTESWLALGGAENPAGLRASVAGDAGFGNRDSWNIPCATNATMPGILIMSTTTR